MLVGFECRGWLTLERHPNRTHADWLDDWCSRPASRYLGFVDSDMEFRKSGWLRGMLDRAQATRAAIVALDIKPTARNMREPVSGRLVRGMPAPTTWLLLLDLPQVADLRESFAFRSIETDAVPEGCIV